MQLRQSTSIALENKGCTYNCHGCVSKFKRHKRKILFDALKTHPDYKLIQAIDLHNRLELSSRYSDTLIFTGDFAEPTKDMDGIREIMSINDTLSRPFVRFEVQTNGSLLLKKEDETKDTNLIELRKMGINTIALSLRDVFSSEKNRDCSQPHKPERNIDIDEVCKQTRLAGHKLRVCANLTKSFEDHAIPELFERVIALGADEVTFRVLYKDESANEPGAPADEKKVYDRITQNAASSDLIKGINTYILDHGEFQEKLPFGAAVYTIKHKTGYLSCVVDADCMAENIHKEKTLEDKIAASEEREADKYFVLYPDGLFGDRARKQKIM